MTWKINRGVNFPTEKEKRTKLHLLANNLSVSDIGILAKLIIGVPLLLGYMLLDITYMKLRNYPVYKRIGT